MLSDGEGGEAAVGGQLGPEWPPRDGDRPGNQNPSSFLPSPPRLSIVQLEMKNLELLHHFTTATYATLSMDEDLREIWRLVVPRIAFSYEFVMHAVLAMSALHLSVLKPTDKSYSLTAAGHHVKALGSLRTAFPAQHPRHAEAIYAASSLTARYVYACPPVVGDNLPKAPSCIPALRGVTAVIYRCWKWVSEGDLSLLLLRKKVDENRYAGEDTEFPSSLFDLSRRGAPGELDPEELEDDHVLGVYSEATEALKLSWDQFWEFDPREAATFKWPCTASDDFVRFLGDQRPRALVLLAHHCAMVELLDDRFWWAKDGGMKEITRIQGVLEEKWKHWLDWPIERCKKNSNGAG